MATEFKRDHVTSPLSLNERPRFYETMRECVVVTRSQLNSQKAFYGTGFFISKSGFILTSSRHVALGASELHVREYGSNDFRVATIVNLVPNKNIAIIYLEPQSSLVAKIPYDHIGVYDGNVMAGMPIYSIGHADELMYNMVEGQVTFPCEDTSSYEEPFPIDKVVNCRFAGDVVKGTQSLFNGLDQDLPLIQINNFHGTDKYLKGYSTSLGAPVFIANGRLIGMCFACVESYDLAIHYRALMEYISKYQTLSFEDAAKEAVKGAAKEAEKREAKKLKAPAKEPKAKNQYQALKKTKT